VLVHRDPVDMRKAYDSLAALVASAWNRDVLAGDVYVFVGKDRRRAKALYWDGTGMCLFAKRLSKGRFAAPWERSSATDLSLTVSELALLFEGCEVVGRMRLSPSPWLPPASTACISQSM
jgi:transposase